MTNAKGRTSSSRRGARTWSCATPEEAKHRVRSAATPAAGPPVLLITLHDGQMNCSMRFLYASLIGAGHAAKVLRFGVTVPYVHDLDYSLFQPLTVKFPTARPALRESDVVALLDLVRRLNPCWIGLNVVAPHNHLARRLTERLRAATTVPIVWGGYAAINEPEFAIEHADVVCVGEGERVVVELTQAIKSGRREYPDIAGIWYRDGAGNVVQTERRPYLQGPEIESIPLIFFERTEDEILIPPDAVEYYSHLPKADGGRGNSGNVVQDVIFSRGCPFRCSFCSHDIEHRRSSGRGRYYRAPSPEWVVEFLKDAKYRLGKSRFLIWDELFPYDPRWVKRFAELYKKEIALPFSINFYARTFRKENFDRLVDAGMDACNIGVQSGSRRVRLECYGRDETNEEILRCAEHMNSRLLVCYDYIIDNPWETADDLREALDFFLQMPRPFVLDTNTLLFFRNASITRRALAEGLIGPENVLGERDHRGTEDVTVTPMLPRTDPEKRALLMLTLVTQHAFFDRDELREWSRKPEFLRDDRLLAVHILQRLYAHTRLRMYEYEWEMEQQYRQALALTEQVRVLSSAAERAHNPKRATP